MSTVGYVILSWPPNGVPIVASSLYTDRQQIDDLCACWNEDRDQPKPARPYAVAEVVLPDGPPGCGTDGCVGDCHACAAVLQATLAAHGLPQMTTGEPL